MGPPKQKHSSSPFARPRRICFLDCSYQYFLFSGSATDAVQTCSDVLNRFNTARACGGYLDNNSSHACFQDDRALLWARTPIPQY